MGTERNSESAGTVFHRTERFKTRKLEFGTESEKQFTPFSFFSVLKEREVDFPFFVLDLCQIAKTILVLVLVLCELKSSFFLSFLIIFKNGIILVLVLVLW